MRLMKWICVACIQIHDTIGLSEGGIGTVLASKVIANLYHLVREVHGGVNLLMYVFWGPRLAQENYNKKSCEKKVPIVIIITSKVPHASRPLQGERWRTWRRTRIWRCFWRIRSHDIVAISLGIRRPSVLVFVAVIYTMHDVARQGEDDKLAERVL